MMITMTSEVAASTISVSAAIPVLTFATSGDVISLDKDSLLVEFFASLVFTRIEVVVGEQAWAAVLLLYHNVSVVKCLDVLLQTRTFILL